MATFALIHGAGDVGWSWHLVAAELRERGHQVVAPDLPSEDEAAGLEQFVQTVVDAVGECEDLVVVGHSFGGFTAALVAERLAASQLIYVAAMIPSPGERPADWWEHSGYAEAVAEQARLDGGLTGHEDPYLSFYHLVPQELADEAMRRSRGQTMTSSQAPWPLAEQPRVPTRALVCREDRFFPVAFLRRVTRERLELDVEEIPGCHCVALSHPRELADALTAPA